MERREKGEKREGGLMVEKLKGGVFSMVVLGGLTRLT